MVKIKKDLSGTVIGDFTVLNRYEEDYIYPNGRSMPQWNVKHICGRELVVKRQDLKNGNIVCECMKPKCTYDLTGEYGIGYTNKKEQFWFDIEDYDKIKDFYWWYDNVGYVQALVGNKHIRLHRLVMNADDPSIIIDHIQHPPRNQHKVDNRKSNLRVVTKSQNNINSHKKKNNTSGITGVCWSTTKQRWKAEIQVDKKKINLGSFIDKNDAIKARREAEQKYFKEFSLNKNNNMEEINNEQYE